MNSFWTSYLLMIPKADSIFAAISHINTYILMLNLLLNIHPNAYALCCITSSYTTVGGVRQKQRISKWKRRATYKTIKKVSPKKNSREFFSLSFLFLAPHSLVQQLYMWDEIVGWEIMKCFLCKQHMVHLFNSTTIKHDILLFSHSVCLLRVLSSFFIILDATNVL